MAFIATERLLQNNLEFLNRMTPSDLDSICKSVRNHPLRNIITDNLVKDGNFYNLYFGIIYDMPLYFDETIRLLELKIGYFDDKMLFNFINSSSRAYNYVINHLDYFLKNKEELVIGYITKIMINNNLDFTPLSRSSNLHYRALFMIEIINKYPNYLNKIYPNLISYLYGYTYEENEQLSFISTIMSESDISNIICALLKSSKNITVLKKVRTFLEENYPFNSLAGKLNAFPEGIIYLKKDINKLFVTSKDYQPILIRQYEDLIADELITKFREDYGLFFNNNYDFEAINKIFLFGLSRTLKEYISKYLDLSKDKSCEKLRSGSTSDCYRIGDFVIKLFKRKYSYEDVICPNLYLIAKNYEELYIRNQRGIVIAGLEVQQYLKRTAKDVSSETISNFFTSLNKAGYHLEDTLVNGSCGDNAFLLETYKDADTNKPENLPDWFKETPLVLVDRDCVFPINSRFPKRIIG